MGDTNNTKAIIRAAAKRKAKGVNSTPRHRAEATAPTTTITNPARIAGIKMAVRNKAVNSLANKCEKIIAHLDVACGIKEGDALLTLTDKEQAIVDKAFALAYNSTPDAARIKGGIPGEQMLLGVQRLGKKKQYSRRGPQVIPARRIVEAEPAATTQIERILSGTVVNDETSQETDVVKPTETVMVRTLPPKRDLTGFSTVSTASRRTKTNA